MAVVAVPFILYLVRFCSSKSCKKKRINSAGALLAGRGQYSTVKNGTRMRYGTVVRLVY